MKNNNLKLLIEVLIEPSIDKFPLGLIVNDSLINTTNTNTSTSSNTTNTDCELLGEFGYIIQGLLGFMCISVLVCK